MRWVPLLALSNNGKQPNSFTHIGQSLCRAIKSWSVLPVKHVTHRKFLKWLCHFPVMLVGWVAVGKEMLSGVKSFFHILGPKNAILCLMAFYMGAGDSLKWYTGVMCSSFLSINKHCPLPASVSSSLKWSRILSGGGEDKVGGIRWKPAKCPSSIRYLYSRKQPQWSKTINSLWH